MLMIAIRAFCYQEVNVTSRDFLLYGVRLLQPPRHQMGLTSPSDAEYVSLVYSDHQSTAFFF
jgi:hypothetical protein